MRRNATRIGTTVVLAGLALAVIGHFSPASEAAGQFLGTGAGDVHKGGDHGHIGFTAPTDAFDAAPSYGGGFNDIGTPQPKTVPSITNAIPEPSTGLVAALAALAALGRGRRRTH